MDLSHQPADTRRSRVRHGHSGASPATSTNSSQHTAGAAEAERARRPRRVTRSLRDRAMRIDSRGVNEKDKGERIRSNPFYLYTVTYLPPCLPRAWPRVVRVATSGPLGWGPRQISAPRVPTAVRRRR